MSIFSRPTKKVQETTDGVVLRAEMSPKELPYRKKVVTRQVGGFMKGK